MSVYDLIITPEFLHQAVEDFEGDFMHLMSLQDPEESKTYWLYLRAKIRDRVENKQ